MLAIFPLLMVILALLMISRQTLHFTVSSDPEYFYLLSGLNIARFDLVSGDYHHPGIPLQIYCGVIISLDYLFSGKHPDIITDVMLRSEHYIYVINISLVLLNGLIFFACGLVIFKLTRNIAASVFLQLVPFTNYTSFFQLTLIVPEKLVLPFLLILVVLIIYFIKINLNKKEEKILIILMSLVIVFSFLQKLTMLPLIFLPPLLFKGKRNFSIYVIALLSITLIVMIPIITHLQEMWRFFAKMATHSGHYGSGNKQFIDLQTIIPSMVDFYHMHPLTLYSLVLIILFVPITYFVNFPSQKLNKIRTVISSLALIETLMFLMLIKHYKAHYATPLIALSLFNFYLIIEFIDQSNLIKRKIIFPITYAALSVFIFTYYFSSILGLFSMYSQQRVYEDQLLKIEEKYTDSPKIIFPKYFGNPFREFAIYQAIYYSRNKELYGKKAKEIYPDSYFYTSQWGLYDMAYNRFKLDEVLSLHADFILSYYDDDTTTINSFNRQIDTLALKEKYTFREVYYNEYAKIMVQEMDKKNSNNE